MIGRFLKVANPLSDTVTKCETMAETATALNHMLLGSRPRRASKGVPITQLWPGLPQELWERWLAYTNANPDAVNSKITLECFMSARLRPVRGQDHLSFGFTNRFRTTGAQLLPCHRGKAVSDPDLRRVRIAVQLGLHSGC